MKINQTDNFEAIAVLNKGVQDVHTQMNPEFFKEYDYEATQQFFKSIMDKPQYIFLLMENDLQPIGYAWLEMKDYKENAFKRSYKSMYIHQIGITESERSKGYGNLLLERISDIAETYEIKKIELDYWCHNTGAKQFYKRNGYEPYKEFVYKRL